MSILNVDKIQPIGSGSTVTVNATDTILTNAQAGVITATRFDGIISATTDDWITHQGDSNTRMGFPATDTFSVETSGTSRIYVESGGDVGIGTDNPHKRFHVADYGTHGAIRVEGSGNGNRSGIEFYRETSAGVSKGGAAIWVESDTSSSAGKLRFGTASNAAVQSQNTDMILDNNGQLGIGTATPDETLELWKASGTNLVKISTQANSTIGLLLEKTGSTTQSWKIADGQTANGTLEIYDATESETRFAIDGSGRVIIGQHSHSGGGTLVVAGNSNTPNAYGCAAFCRIQANPTSGTTLAQLRFSAGSGGTNRAAEISVQADSNWNDGTNQESKMIFKVATSGGGNTAGNALMTLKGNGNVEINRGNLVVSNGKGIDFSAQTASSASGVTTNNETLDHFEEGTWTPTQATLGSWKSGVEIDGKYHRVGNWVTASFIVQYPSNGSGHAASIDGLPYVNNNSGNSYKQGGCVNYSNNSNVSSLLIENGGSRIYIYNSSGATINLTNMDNVEVRGTVIYRVS